MALAFYAHLSRVATGVAMCCAKSGTNVDHFSAMGEFAIYALIKHLFLKQYLHGLLKSMDPKKFLKLTKFG